MKSLITLIIAAVLVGALAGVGAIYLPVGGEPPKLIVIEIRKGQPSSEICRFLEQNGIVSSGSRFYWIGRVFGKWNQIRAGEYEVRSSQNALELFETLTSGVSIAHPFTIPEGSNLYEIGRALEEKSLGSSAKFIQIVSDTAFLQSVGLGTVRSAEGYLYPETYALNRTMTEADIARGMVQLFRKNWDPAWDERAKELGFSRQEIVTLASMIEKETGAPAERPLISSVFHNRLKKRMRLQSDPTTIYGIGPTYSGNLHRSDLLEPTPYNTYTLAALPVGPIANPGREAIQAALYPATSEYLYFVSHNDGTHEFTRTYENHLAAVKRFQLNPKAREGKSWRDLKSPSTSQ